MRGLERGGVLDLPTAGRLARRWYRDRLDPDWDRLPVQAVRELFAELGMIGPFWALQG